MHSFTNATTMKKKFVGFVIVYSNLSPFKGLDEYMVVEDRACKATTRTSDLDKATVFDTPEDAHSMASLFHDGGKHHCMSHVIEVYDEVKRVLGLKESMEDFVARLELEIHTRRAY